jgi:biopolymer transport protein ExbD
MFKKRERSTKNRINAGSMADIAFLLLIFFLVATKINEDKSLTVILPSFNDEVLISGPSNKKLLKIYINGHNEILVDDTIVPVQKMKEKVKTFISVANLKAESQKQKAIVMLKNDSNTSYERYIQVYDELKKSYNELRKEFALSEFSKTLSELDASQLSLVAKMHPIQISESD